MKEENFHLQQETYKSRQDFNSSPVEKKETLTKEKNFFGDNFYSPDNWYQHLYSKLNNSLSSNLGSQQERLSELRHRFEKELKEEEYYESKKEKQVNA